ncbi:MAG: 6-bladed beta-propeller, partial [Bacteroidales bacterium]
IFYTPIRCDTIFEIDKNGIKRGIYIDFGKRALPLDYLKRGFSEGNSAALMKSGYAVNLRSVLETDRFFYCAFLYGTHLRTVFYDKVTHEHNPHLFFAEGQPNAFRTTYGNYFVAKLENAHDYNQVSTNDIQRAIEERRSPEHRAIIQKAREGDNPVLYFVEIKPAEPVDPSEPESRDSVQAL